MKLETKRNFYHYYLFCATWYMLGSIPVSKFYEFTLEGKIVGCNIGLAILFSGFAAFAIEKFQPVFDKKDIYRSIAGALIGVNLTCWLEPNYWVAGFFALTTAIILYTEFKK